MIPKLVTLDLGQLDGGAALWPSIPAALRLMRLTGLRLYIYSGDKGPRPLSWTLTLETSARPPVPRCWLLSRCIFVNNWIYMRTRLSISILISFEGNETRSTQI